MTFFAVLIRFGVLIALLPFTGDRVIPAPVKVLFALSVSIVLFPALVATGQVKPGEALYWGATTGGIVATIASEALFGLILGFTARLTFDSIHFGANLVGTFMGFAMASTYDPHQESQTQVVAEIQMAVAMLIFLALDGHHLMLRAVLESYRIVGMGKAGINAIMTARLLEMTGQVIQFGIQIAAPVAVSLFGVNVVFGIMAKAMPQLNILSISFAVTALVGLIVMFLGIPQFQGVAGNILERTSTWMEAVQLAMVGR